MLCVSSDILPVEKNIHLLSSTPSIFRFITKKLEFASPVPSPPPRGAPPSFSAPSNPRRVSTLFDRPGERGPTTTSRNTNYFPGTGYRVGDGAPTDN